MRFKISAQHRNGHKRLVTCVAWSSAEEIYSCGEDHLLISWHLEGGIAHSSIVTEFPDDFYPTDMQWHPRPHYAVLITKKQSLDVLLITTADGKYHLVNKNGRIEKSIDAHKGATTVGRWNNDGTALLTAGEDGLMKIWSRSGMLRSVIVKGMFPILSAAWSPDCTTVLYSQGAHLTFQSLNSNSKPRKLLAHDGLILVLSWCHTHGLIISGGEDCRYKVWDSSGTQLFSSSVGDHPVTAVNWSYSGDYFAVGSFNTIKLCDKTGWSHSLEKINAGSIYSIAWSSDSTQVSMACSNGTVLTGHIIDRRLEWNNYEAILVTRKVIEVRDVGNEIRETLEISDRVVQLEFGFDHLVVITPAQCHIYSVVNWNTPAIFDLKNTSVSAVLLAEKHFLLVEWNSVSLYSYQGRLLGTPKWKGMTQERLYPPCVSLCSDTLVIRSQSNEKQLYVLEVAYNKPITENQAYTHLQNISRVALNYIGGVNDRQVALIDTNKDLFLVSIRTTGFGRVCKIAAMAQDIKWATDANVLAAMLDATLSVWLCPNCVHYSDRKIIRKTRIDKESSEFGKQPSIANVYNGMVMIRRGDGALVASSFYTFFISLHQHILNKRWKEAVSLCRIAQNEILWTCMAVMATDNKELNAAEEAYAAISRYDKVDYIQYIKSLPNKTERLAEMALLSGDLLTAEGILLQNGLVEEAIRINIEVYNWNRALELAIRHKKQLDEVLNARRKYLNVINKKETNQSFLAYMTNVAKSQDAEEKISFKRDEVEQPKAERQMNETLEQEMHI
ncbi:Intraflagellar transport protein 80 like protein [Habropoda laboriosa]|uniref:Intraflagellar transport protein 80 like protein n=1 Tax=Habropoda laboriosa TaxID=597456 RepID=A0A0L7QYX6_9HYME|nr:PREDICTED: intraflagellar transport protein 80 homolog [Habropoda laboriosa]KOC63788.1 Intraflagellar transport protein 80 like protein [Habropoda laboriosa]